MQRRVGFAAIADHARAPRRRQAACVQGALVARQCSAISRLTCADIHAQRVRDWRGSGLRCARRRRRARGKVRRANVKAEVGRAASRVQRHEGRVGARGRREEGDLTVRRHGDGGGGRPRLADARPKAVDRADVGHCGRRASRFTSGAGRSAGARVGAQGLPRLSAQPCAALGERKPHPSDHSRRCKKCARPCHRAATRSGQLGPAQVRSRRARPRRRRAWCGDRCAENVCSAKKCTHFLFADFFGPPGFTWQRRGFKANIQWACRLSEFGVRSSEETDE